MDIGVSQNTSEASTGPRVVIPTGNRPTPQNRPAQPTTVAKYPWRTYATNTGSSPSATTQDHAVAQKEYEAYLQELRERELKRQQIR